MTQQYKTKYAKLPEKITPSPQKKPEKQPQKQTQKPSPQNHHSKTKPSEPKKQTNTPLKFKTF